MRINVVQPLKNFKGEDITEGETVITFREAVATAVNIAGKDQTAEDKNKCYQIGLKLYSGNDVDFTISELALIKEKVAAIYSPVVVGRVGDIIEGPKTDEDQAKG